MIVNNIQAEEIMLFHTQLKQFCSTLANTTRDSNTTIIEFADILENEYNDFIQQFLIPEWRAEGSQLTVSDLKTYKDNIEKISGYAEHNFGDKISKLGKNKKKLKHGETQAMACRKAIKKSLKILEHIFKNTKQIQLPLLIGAMNAILNSQNKKLDISIQ